MTLTKSPAHWRQQADDLRDQADRTHDTAAKQALLNLADDYELLATRSEELGGWENDPDSHKET